MNQSSPPNLRILLVEDEFITLDLLRDALEDLNYVIAGDAMSVEEAKQVLRTTPVDLAILDINVRGERKGIELARHVRDEYGIPFIYLTAYSDVGTIEAATATAPYGYLIKPFTPADIHAAIRVAAARMRGKEKDHHHLLLRDQSSFFRVRAADIRYVEAFRNYLEIHLPEGKRLVRGTLREMLGQLPTELFFQPHRSYLVNGDAVTAYRDGELWLGADERVPVSKKGHRVVSAFFANRG